MQLVFLANTVTVWWAYCDCYSNSKLFCAWKRLELPCRLGWDRKRNYCSKMCTTLVLISLLDLHAVDSRITHFWGKSNWLYIGQIYNRPNFLQGLRNVTALSLSPKFLLAFLWVMVNVPALYIASSQSHKIRRTIHQCESRLFSSLSCSNQSYCKNEEWH